MRSTSYRREISMHYWQYASAIAALRQLIRAQKNLPPGTLDGAIEEAFASAEDAAKKMRDIRYQHLTKPTCFNYQKQA